MRISVWHRTEEQTPGKSGHYLSYRGWGMGGKADGDHDYGYMYYDKKTNEWYEYSDKRDTAIVYYWTDATPDDWTDQDPPSVVLRRGGVQQDHVAVQEALADVEEALKRYQTVRSLCQK